MSNDMIRNQWAWEVASWDDESELFLYFSSGQDYDKHVNQTTEGMLTLLTNKFNDFNPLYLKIVHTYPLSIVFYLADGTKKMEVVPKISSADTWDISRNKEFDLLKGQFLQLDQWKGYTNKDIPVLLKRAMTRMCDWVVDELQRIHLNQAIYTTVDIQLLQKEKESWRKVKVTLVTPNGAH